MNMAALSKSFKHTYDSDLQKNICSYLKGLRDTSYTRLLQGVDSEAATKDIIIGELRIIQKLLSILEPKVEIVEINTSLL